MTPFSMPITSSADLLTCAAVFMNTPRLFFLSSAIFFCLGLFALNKNLHFQRVLALIFSNRLRNIFIKRSASTLSATFIFDRL